jgi:sigma-B regulation protein RsbU (phosphoserine phosphatase)
MIPMPPRLYKLWVRWSIIATTVLVLMALGIGALAERSARSLATPELEQTTQTIGRSLNRDLERALHYRIPIDSVVGLQPWFNEVVDNNDIISMLALTDAHGKLLAAYGLEAGVGLEHSLPTRLTAQSGYVGAMYIGTIAVHDREGHVAGWLHIGSTPPSAGVMPWVWSLLAALVLALLSTAALRGVIQHFSIVPLAACHAAAASLVEGKIMRLATTTQRNPAGTLQNTLAWRIDALRRRNDELLMKVGEIRASHFDPALLSELDQLAAPLLERQRQYQDPNFTGERRQRQQMVNLSRRAWLAAAVAMLILTVCVTTALQLYHNGDKQRLTETAEQTLQQAWRATLAQDQTVLDAKLQEVMAQPSLMRLLGGDNNSAVGDVLEQLATPELALAIFNMDGSVLAASGQRSDKIRLDALTLEPLRRDETEVRGVWQNAAHVYQSGLARKITLDDGRQLVLMAALPLDISLLELHQRLNGAEALVDLRGQPVTLANTSLVAQWKRFGRRSHVFDKPNNDGGDTAVLATLPLSGPSGHALGTLLLELPTQHQLDAGDHSLMLVALAVAATAVLALFWYLHQLFAPVTRATQKLQQVAEGRYSVDGDAASDLRAAEAGPLLRVTRRIAEKMESFEKLRRSRDRQGRRQARFIRHQMMQLAERLDEKARVGILQDLERIEHAGRPVAGQTEGGPDDPRVERMLDEFGILALGFQNLVSRVGEQYLELDRMVLELREALRAKTQFIALQQELEIARNMQLSILPREFTTRDGLELHATMLPAKEVGGDFYDFFPLDDYRVALVVADVSGKGVPAAFFMAVSRTLLRAIAQFGDSPGPCVARLNDLLAADNEELMFVTLFYGIFDTRDGTLLYANAGHNLPYLVQADGHVSAVPGTGGLALAVMEGVHYREGQVTLAPGDTLFLYTDGITESCAPNDEMYGEQRLVETLPEIRHLPVREVPAHIVALIKQFEAGGAQADDITCLVARYRGPV